LIKNAKNNIINNNKNITSNITLLVLYLELISFNDVKIYFYRSKKDY